MTSIAHTSAVERIARVLSADALSSDGLPAGDAAIAPAVSDRVDESWSQEVQRACAVLHTLREPTEAMVASLRPAPAKTCWIRSDPQAAQAFS